MPVLILKRFQQAGHTPIALLGGTTTMIGALGVKATGRKRNTPDVIGRPSSASKVTTQH